MNRLGRQLLSSALRGAKYSVTSTTTTTTSRTAANTIRLYSVNSVQGCRTLYANHKLSLDGHQIYISKRFSSQKPSVNEEDDSIENQPATDEEVAKFFQEHQIHVQGLGDPNINKPIFDFSKLQMDQKLQALMTQYKYDTPTPIQSQSLPILFSGRDLIGIAQTGSGKTLAYLLPALQKYMSLTRDYFSNPEGRFIRKNPKVLILAPTRELACQIFDVVRQFRMFKGVCCYGGSDRNKQMRFLEENNPLIVVSTPGRLKDLVDSRVINLSEVEYLVVDEADRMLDMGFEPQISYLINHTKKEGRQTMMFSATWPDEVKSLVHKYLRPNHAFLSVGGTKLVANHNIRQTVHVCPFHERNDILADVIEKHKKDKMIVFANTKSACDRVARLISGKCRVRAFPIHGDLSQRQRETTLQDFKAGRIQVLCATNVAARGLDIDDVNVVINYDMDEDVETYVHRIGRTGRKQNKGHAYSFFIDESKTKLARDLIEVMVESDNEVPEELREIAKRASSGGSAKRGYGFSYGHSGGRYERDAFNFNKRGGSGGYSNQRSSGGGYQGRPNNSNRFRNPGSQYNPDY